jgi:gamma-glutamyltranspeptidase/glutathione hydrolase
MTPAFTTRPELAGSFGMAASTHWMATATAMSILERGGNAFDAAVAGGFVLQVVEPHLNGPGGDLPVVLWSAERGEALVVCGQGVAPAAASIPLLRDELGLDLVPGTGLLPACVPGAFDGWMLLLRDFGTMRLGEVLEHAIALASGGFPLVERITTTVADVTDLFAVEWPTSAAVWLPDGRPPAARTMFRTPGTATTYARIVREAEAATGDREGQIEHARDAWLRGCVAEEIVAWTSSHEVLDSSGRRHAGLLTGDDLANWSATVEAPVRGGYAGLEICKTGPWGQGPMLLETLRLLEGYDLPAMGRGAEFVHTVVEALKLAFADREAFFGDADPDAIPLDALLSAEYAAERRALIGERASDELRPGRPGGAEGRMPVGGGATAATIGAGEPTLGDTCHLDVADRFGNLVACTPSGGWLQSSPVIPALGFPLGTRGQMFWLEEGLPSSLAGGRRPRTTLSPSLALRDGQPWLAFGTPGGDQQDQWSLQFFLNVVDFGMELQEALDAPTVQSTHFPGSFYPHQADPGGARIESRVSPEVIDSLLARGHKVKLDGPWAHGQVTAVAREPNGVLSGAASPRGRVAYVMGR